MSIERLRDLLKESIPDEEKFELYWSGRPFCLKTLFLKNGYTDENDFDSLLSDYYCEYPAAPVYKERVLRPFFVEWYQNATDILEKYDRTKDLFPD